MDIFSSKKKARHAKIKAKKEKKNVSKKPLSKKQKKLLIILISIVSALTVILGTGIGFLIWMTSDYNYNDEVGKDEELQSIKPIEEGIVNIALFGIDTRDDASFKGRSDSIMILSVNKSKGYIKLISLMRDSLVEIPKESGTVYNKVNSSYAFGGPTLAIKTINKNFGLDIKEYATVNFYGMADIIDAVGGIEIDVQEKEIHAKSGLNDNIKEQAKSIGIKNPTLVKKGGLQKLSGMQAVAWARIRSVSTAGGTSNDYGRTDRQRVVMEKLLGKALSMKVSEYPNLIKKMLPYVETSLSYSEILGLSGILSKDIQFTQTRVPQSEYVITAPKISGVGSVVYYNRDFAKDIIHSYIYSNIEQEEYLETHEIVRKGWYTGPTAGSSSSTTTSKPSGSTSGNGNSQTNTNTSSTPASNTSSTVTSSKDTSSNVVSSNVTSSSVISSEEVSSEETVTSEEVSSEEVISSEEASGEEMSSEAAPDTATE